jgi:hypothetical protein
MSFVDRYKINRALRSVSDYDMDDILHRVGLRRRTIAADLAADLGFFAIGAICGAVAGVFLAPSRGAELRRDVKKAFNERGFQGLGDVVRQQASHA